MLTEQEFAKNVIKTAEGAKANVTLQVQFCLLDVYQQKYFSAYRVVLHCIIESDFYNTAVFVTLYLS